MGALVIVLVDVASRHQRKTAVLGIVDAGSVSASPSKWLRCGASALALSQSG